MASRILVVDDEESLCEILKYNLEKEGFEVDTAFSAEEALTMDLESYNLFILDIMMDRMNGFELAKQMRRTPNTQLTPIIFCSALTGEDDTVMGLNIGADDYIRKPFSVHEMVARVKAVLRRAQTRQEQDKTPQPEQKKEVLTYKGLSLDPNEKLCLIDGEPVGLTKTELEILNFFLTHSNRIYSREEILHHVWPGDTFVTTRTIDTNITRLRKKIGSYGSNIETRLGFGYGFKEKD